ncbi:MAG: Dyp-type peroxidase [Acidimicrobiales bacterium]
MNVAQAGIFAQGTRAHHHLEFALRADAADDRLREALRSLREPSVTVGGANIVVGLGPATWRRLAPGDAPAALADFVPIAGADGRGAPATQHDVWVWIHGTGTDLVLDTARAVDHCMRPIAQLALEQPGFVYRDSRDLTGFIDGTENPPVEEAPEVALVETGPGALGAFAMTMRWVHDLDAFGQLAVAEQEDVIGRTKDLSVELDDDRKPPTAHIARVVVEENGEELEIYRRSVPYGTVGELGLFFVAFSADPRRFHVMLTRMFDLDGDGVHDRLTEFSRPVSGSYWFVPSLALLERVMGGPRD